QRAATQRSASQRADRGPRRNPSRARRAVSRAAAQPRACRGARARRRSPRRDATPRAWDLAACPDTRRHRAFVIVGAGILRGTFPNTGPLKSSFAGGVRECRGRLAADDRRGLVDELIVLEGLHHEQGKIHAARDVALENGVAHVPAPHGQALTLALLEVAAAHDGPARVAGKHPAARLYLVVEVR